MGWDSPRVRSCRLVAGFDCVKGKLRTFIRTPERAGSHVMDQHGGMIPFFFIMKRLSENVRGPVTMCHSRAGLPMVP